MPIGDKETNAAARRVLSSMWVDITRVHISTVRGTIYVRGFLQRMTASHADLDPSTLAEMDRRLRALSGVRGVQYALDNWYYTLNGMWLPRQGRAAGSEAAPPPAAGSPLTPPPAGPAAPASS